MPNQFTVAGLSDVGRIRRRNEDSIALDPEHGVAVVADGMGGHPGGDVASAIAARSAADELTRSVDDDEPTTTSGDRMREAMRRAVLAAHEAVLARGAAEPELEGMGTTLTAVVVDRESGAFVVGHVGDSRAYRLRDGLLEQLTRDDTWVQQQVELGEMDAARAKHSPYAHLLTQCIGLEEAPTPQILEGTARPGDALLLCTDGLVGMIDDEIIRSILSEAVSGGSGIAEAVGELLRAANNAGGHDNITAAVVHFVEI